MATNFPSSADSFTNPTSGDTLDNPPHDQQHANINDAMEAVQAALLDGAPLHVDATNNRVGIGTTSPNSKVHIVGDSSTNPTNIFAQGYVANGAVDTRTGTIRNTFDSNADYGTYWTGFRGANGSSYKSLFGVRTGGTDNDVLTIDSSGNVGINDNTPSYTLDVNGDINATGDLRIGGTAVGEAVTTWQPTWDSGVTVGNGTVTTSYYVLNDFVYYTVDFELGSTSAITGDIRIYHPFTADSKWQVAANLSGFAYDYSSATYYAVMGRTYLEARSTVRYARQHAGTNQAIYARQFSSTEPFTWGTSDRLVFSTWYKKA